MVSAPFLIGVALWLATLYAIRRWIGAMAPRLWGIARGELAKAHGEAAAKEQKALREATDKRANELLQSVRRYQDDIAMHYRKLVADAEVRARVADARANATDRQAEEAVRVLNAAYLLLSEVKVTREGLGDLAPIFAELLALLEKAVSAAPGGARAADEVHPLRAKGVDEENSDEETKVIRPALEPLRVPDRRPPPVPHPRAVQEGHQEEGGHGAELPPAHGAKGRKS